MKFSRREFLKMTAGAGAGLALTAGDLTDLFAQESPRGPLPSRPDERMAPGVCGLCSGGCGLLARVVRDRVVKLRGSPFNPLNRGRLCAKGLAGTQLLYHPARILRPLKREGRRGEGRFRPLTWPEALDEFASIMKRPDGARVVAPPSRSQLGHLRRKVFSKATLLEHRAPDDVAPVNPALYLTQGIWGTPACDLASSDLVLSFDSGLLDSYWHPCETMRLYADAREKLGCRLIHVESRRSVTGAKADERLVVRPGKEAALALGLAHLIIKEGLADLDFLERHTFGFGDWLDEDGKHHAGFRSLVLTGSDPRRVSDETGVPIEAMIRISRRFAGARRPVALGSALPGLQGPFTQMAIHCLNALVGSLERPGGWLIPRIPGVDPLASGGPSSAPSPAGKAFLSGPHGVEAEAALAEAQEAPRALVITETDLLGRAIAPEEVEKTLRRSEHVVVLSSLHNLTVNHADLVLPVSTYLERMVDFWDHTSAGYPLVAVCRPVVEPLGDSRPEGDILMELAKRLGRGLPFESYQDIVEAAMQQIHALGSGQLFGLEHEEVWMQVMEQSGWKPPTVTGASSFFQAALEVGGWWDPVYYRGEWQRVLNTPSGKFEFYSQSLEKKLKRDGPVRDRDVMPHQEPVSAAHPDFPLELELFTPPSVGGPAGALSWLRDLAGSHVNAAWDTWVELNPVTARQLGLADGDSAVVRSTEGSIRATVVSNPLVPPRTAALPTGLAPTDTDNSIEVNPRVLVRPRVEHLVGRYMTGVTRVAVTPA